MDNKNCPLNRIRSWGDPRRRDLHVIPATKTDGVFLPHENGIRPGRDGDRRMPPGPCPDVPRLGGFTLCPLQPDGIYGLGA